MVVYFFDSSSIVKRYGKEMGSAWIKSLTVPAAGNLANIALITAVEVVSAITRKARGGGLSAIDAKTAITQFRLELLNLYIVLDITSALIDEAMELAEKHALRGYDAVQLAAALNVNTHWVGLGMPAITLVSADDSLNAAAIAEGLVVDNPNNHP
jgi:predicted nucleic acid-binding protein